MTCSLASNGTTRPYRVLVVGASYAGLAFTVNLLDLCHGLPCRFATGGADAPAVKDRQVPVDITIADERDGYCHLIGIPLACASEEYADRAWVKFSDIPALKTPQVRVIRGRVTSVDCAHKTARIRVLGGDGIEEIVGYDYLVAASGLQREGPSAPQALSKTDYLGEYRRQIEQARNARDGVVVVGGGAVGVEIASELKQVNPKVRVTLVHSRYKVLSSEPVPDEYRDRTLDLLQESGVETVLGCRVQDTMTTQNNCKIITLTGGKILTASHVICAISRFSASAPYLPTTTADEHGYIKINPDLTIAADIPNADCHYVAGDLAACTGIKRAGAAMHHGHFAAMNIHQHMLHNSRGVEPRFREIAVAKPGICIAVGPKAISWSQATGLQAGEDVLKLCFEDDLGFGICWRYMGLGVAPISVVG